jgi:aminoglycoside 6'-N-acetyltransferase I
MAAQLWPEATDHAAETAELAGNPDSFTLLTETVQGSPCGFATISIRPYANGCASRPVGYLEGIWVREDLRRRGVGGQLLQRAEEQLAARGLTELASDVLLDNLISQGAHLAWGFSEAERVVCYCKPLARREEPGAASAGEPGRSAGMRPDPQLQGMGGLTPPPTRDLP